MGKKTWAMRKKAAEAISRHQEFYYRATELSCKENQIFGRDILMGIDVKKSLFLQPCSQIGLSQQVKLFQRHTSYHNSPLFPLEGELFLMKLLRFQIIIKKISLRLFQSLESTFLYGSHILVRYMWSCVTATISCSLN